MTEGYCTRMALDADDRDHRLRVRFLGKLTDFIKKGIEPNEAYEKGQWVHTARFRQRRQVHRPAFPRQGIRRARRMATFEGYERREAQILEVLKEYGILDLRRVQDDLRLEKGVDPYTIVQESSPSALRTRSGPTRSAAPSRSRRAAPRLQTPLPPSASACRPSASPAPSRKTARSASATATWAPCCSARRPSASRSSRATSPSPPRKAPSSIALNANKVRKKPLRVILNGLGKDAAYIISASTASPT
jgi:hypothetical protein